MVEVMIIELSPIASEKDKIVYVIQGESITATIDGVTDVFDFSDMPNGELQTYDDNGNLLIETPMDDIPIRSAKRTNGELVVKLLYRVGIYEKDERLLFPKPMSVDEFNALMKELVERDKAVEDESVDDVEEDSDDSLEETDDLAEPDGVVNDDIIVEDERVDGEEPVHKNDDIIDLEEGDEIGEDDLEGQQPN